MASTGSTSGAAMPSAAPKLAPAAVPIMYGSAIGLRSSAWKTVPAMASPPPTSMAVSTRGSRMSKMIVSALGAHVSASGSPSSRCARIAAVSPTPDRGCPSPPPTTR